MALENRWQRLFRMEREEASRRAKEEPSETRKKDLEAINVTEQRMFAAMDDDLVGPTPSGLGRFGLWRVRRRNAAMKQLRAKELNYIEGKNPSDLIEEQRS